MPDSHLREQVVMCQTTVPDPATNIGCSPGHDPLLGAPALATTSGPRAPGAAKRCLEAGSVYRYHYSTAPCPGPGRPLLHSSTHAGQFSIWLWMARM